jgi:hypothetical protein
VGEGGDKADVKQVSLLSSVSVLLCCVVSVSAVCLLCFFFFFFLSVWFASLSLSHSLSQFSFQIVASILATVTEKQGQLG